MRRFEAIECRDLPLAHAARISHDLAVGDATVVGKLPAQLIGRQVEEEIANVDNAAGGRIGLPVAEGAPAAPASDRRQGIHGISQLLLRRLEQRLLLRSVGNLGRGDRLFLDVLLLFRRGLGCHGLAASLLSGRSGVLLGNIAVVSRLRP